MEFIDSIKARIPDYAKRHSPEPRRHDLALVARRHRRGGRRAGGGHRGEEHGAHQDDPRSRRPVARKTNAVLTAAALMGMNNTWYPYVEMADDADLKTQRAELRMGAYATHGGVDKRKFEMYALAASIVGKCHFCVKSHHALLKNEQRMTVTQLRDVGRIASVINAAAQVIAAEGE